MLLWDVVTTPLPGMIPVVVVLLDAVSNMVVMLLSDMIPVVIVILEVVFGVVVTILSDVSRPVVVGALLRIEHALE